MLELARLRSERMCSVNGNHPTLSRGALCIEEKGADMDVFEAVSTVLAIRKFKADPIPDPVLDKIVQAGHLTASAMNRQPWHFVVVEDKATLVEIGRLAKTGPYVAEAPVAIVVGREARSAITISDVARAIQSMILTAWAEGIGSNWVGFSDLDAIQVLVGIPENYEVIAVLPLGYPDQPAGRGQKKRKPIGEVVSRGHYGEPWS